MNHKTGGEMTAMVVDDEPLARQRLKEMLSEYPGIAVIGEAGRLAEAKRLAREAAPDAIFLDIQLFGENGFDLLADLPEHTQVVFVTAFDEYAIRAFEVNALDYLMKPVDPARLAITVRRLFGAALPDSSAGGKFGADDRLLLRVGRRRWFEPLASISAIRASGDYTLVSTIAGEEALVRRSMKSWLAALPADMFMRIHRRAIVNFQAIQRIDHVRDGRVYMRMAGMAAPLEASRRLAPAIARRLKKSAGLCKG